MFHPRSAPQVSCFLHLSECLECSPHARAEELDWLRPDHLGDLRREPLPQCCEQVVRQLRFSDAERVINVWHLHVGLCVTHNCRSGHDFVEPQFLCEDPKQKVLEERAGSSKAVQCFAQLPHNALVLYPLSRWFHEETLFLVQWRVHERHAEVADHCCELLKVCSCEEHSYADPAQRA